VFYVGTLDAIVLSRDSQLKENSMTVISLQEYKDNKAKSNMAKTFKSASDMDARIERIKNSISRINSLMAQLREERKES